MAGPGCDGRAGNGMAGLACVGQACLRQAGLRMAGRLKRSSYFRKIPMGKCWAFYPIAGTRSAWIPCVREAEEGRRYCRRHWDALAGVMLGSILHADDERKKAAAERLKRGGCEREGGVVTRGQRKKSRAKQLPEQQEKVNASLKSPADDPQAGNLRVAGGSERGRGAPVQEPKR